MAHTKMSKAQGKKTGQITITNLDPLMKKYHLDYRDVINLLIVYAEKKEKANEECTGE